ncbi:septum site-determining protein MinC [Iodobacter ciconiae]|uniref:Probable septum site-determining protein MinC n=1 Tax=Iodobacter ciconiae TaxID=2496266 RepID=A0A3S8ZSG8_9NEIS|nr:septum site-determining protein MinC [Iodobacter ciconiae]AZN36463.1 septum site-determining protein MinC [Iodobacter ciconiae]
MTNSATDLDSIFEFKSSSIKLLSFVPATLDPARLEAALFEKLGGREHFLAGEQLIIDFSSLPELPSALEISTLVRLLQQFSLCPIAVHGGNSDQKLAASAAGLVVLQDDSLTAPLPYGKAAPPPPALVITRPVRTGQQVYAKGGDLIVLALVSAGAEVIADGNIHVYAPLRGRALAGAKGENQARIFTTCMEAELVSIGGIYRSLQEDLPDSIKTKPAQIYLDQEKIVIEALNETN